VIVSNKHRFAFIHVPKTGGSSVTAHLARFVDRPKPIGIGHGWQPKHHNVGRLHSHLKDTTRWIGEHPDHRVVAFCRNPFDRAVSLWRIYPYKIGQPFTSWVRDFVENVPTLIHPRTRTPVLLDHGLPQTTFVTPEVAHFIGRYESFDLSLRQLCDFVGVPQPEAIPHVNRNENIAHKAPPRPRHYSEVYDDEARDAIAHHWRDDLEAFGYEFEDEGR